MVGVYALYITGMYKKHMRVIDSAHTFMKPVYTNRNYAKGLMKMCYPEADFHNITELWKTYLANKSYYRTYDEQGRTRT